MSPICCSRSRGRLDWTLSESGMTMFRDGVRPSAVVALALVLVGCSREPSAPGLQRDSSRASVALAVQINAPGKSSYVRDTATVIARVYVTGTQLAQVRATIGDSSRTMTYDPST